VKHAFPTGTLVLDLLGTRRGRRDESPVELLAEPRDLADWLHESGLFEKRPVTAPSDLAAALELREAVYALVQARLDGARLPSHAVAIVDAAAARTPLVPALVAGRRVRRGTAAQALADLAREAVEVVGGPNAELLRECARPGCTQVYVDASRGRRREWCSMALCGSRVKAAAYRARKAEAVPA